MEMPEILDLMQAAYSNPRATCVGALQDAWIAGKDFRIMLNGPYCSVRDSAAMREQGVKSVMLWLSKREGIEVKL